MQITRTHHWCVAHPLAIQSIFSLDGIFVDWCGFVDWRGDKPLAVSVAAGGTASLSLHSALRGFPVLPALWFVLFDRSGYLTLQRTP